MSIGLPGQLKDRSSEDLSQVRFSPNQINRMYEDYRARSSAAATSVPTTGTTTTGGNTSSSGTLTLGGTTTGGSNTSSSGILVLNNGASTRFATGGQITSGTLTVSPGGSFTNAAGSSATLNGFQLGNSGVLNTGSASNNEVIRGTLIKNDSGTLLLGGGNQYVGSTLNQDGILCINSGAVLSFGDTTGAASAILTNSGGSLSFTGDWLGTIDSGTSILNNGGALLIPTTLDGNLGLDGCVIAAGPDMVTTPTIDPDTSHL